MIVFLTIIIFLYPKVNAYEIESIQKNTREITAEKIAEKFCAAKSDNFFEGLDNEKTLKYTYFRYIGIRGEKGFLKDIHEPLISEIRDQCLISDEEVRELNEFFLKEYDN